MNNTITLALVAMVLASVTGIIQVHAQTTVTTTTTSQHVWNGSHWLWRHGLENPYGLFQGNNIVVVPSTTLAQAVVNTCPADKPIQLSTGVCITTQQALYLIQTGQLQLAGNVQANGQVIVGTPTILGVQGYSDPFLWAHAHHFWHEHNEQAGAVTVTTTP